jgi:hypothetical protein
LSSKTYSVFNVVKEKAEPEMDYSVKNKFEIDILIKALCTITKRRASVDTAIDSKNNFLRYLARIKNRNQEFSRKNHIINSMNLQRDKDNTWTVSGRWFTKKPAIY